MVIIFGATGFIGIYLAERLSEQGTQILATDINSAGIEFYEKKGISFVSIDITKKEDFKKLPVDGVEAVIHLAAMQPANVSETTYDPLKYIEVNVIGTINVLEYCRKSKINKIIYTSSHRNTQGLWKYGKPVREKDGRSIKYDGEYAMFSISESAAQDCVEHYRKQHGLKGIIFRLPPVYGYGPHTKIFWHGKPVKTGFQIFIENAMAGKAIEVWGDCRIGRDIIYIKDVTEAFILALKCSDVEGLYNISSGRSIPLIEEVQNIIKIFCGKNGESKIFYKPEKSNSIEPFRYDNSKAKEDFGWEPKYSFEDMLIDYKREMESGQYSFLVEKRMRMLEKQ
ncbi:MAG: NAD(P)-dependent oxidoreductase [Desulfobacterales bacterium]|nr:NAD(P)-dependent oxidoreductase [Desulfobacterales bacterium]